MVGLARGRGRLLVTVAGLVSAGTVAAIVWTVVGGPGLPPRVITLATGPEGGSYAAYGSKYREILARQGLEVRLRSTKGDVENLALLRDPRSGVSAAFLQSGTTTAQESPELVSLGALFYQPIWLFRRSGAGHEGPFGGRRVSIGPEGSGTRAIMAKVLKLLGVNTAEYDVLALPSSRAADELQAGRIDGMALVAGWESPLVQRLVRDPDLEEISAVRADAFVALEPWLEKLVLPMGVADMARNLPPRDVTLVATTASLVARDDLHPAVQYLLLEAADVIHGGPGVFQKAGRFPAAEGLDLPLADTTRRYSRQGRPFLQRYLPFWMAVLVERLALVLVPLIGIVLPLLRTAPSIYIGVMNRRIMRLYRDLRAIEAELEDRAPGDDTGDLAQRAAVLQLRADHVRVPLSLTRWVYTLKQHIELVQAHLLERRTSVLGQGARDPALASERKKGP